MRVEKSSFICLICIPTVATCLVVLVFFASLGSVFACLESMKSPPRQSLIFTFGHETIKLECDITTNMAKDTELFVTYLESRVDRGRRSQTPHI